MDIVYTVRPGEVNEELRYSLRSLKNLPHDNVIIVGYKPTWVKNASYIPTEQWAQTGKKYHFVFNNLKKVCKSSLVSDDFIFMNDDFYILQPLEELPVYHRGTMNEVLDFYEVYGKGFYYRHMQDVKALLQKLGHSRAKSYELHVPMAFNKKKLLKVLEIAEEYNIFNKRTLYGNIYNIGGTKIKDNKTKMLRGMDWTENDLFLSSNDQDLKKGKLAEFLKKKFPDPCEYEKIL